MATIYISCDVETDGPAPGLNSMLSIGCAAFDKNGKMISTFSANLEELEGSSADEDTAAWWLTQPEAWKACRENTYPPKEVMVRLNDWVLDLGGRPVFVAYPFSNLRRSFASRRSLATLPEND